MQYFLMITLLVMVIAIFGYFVFLTDQKYNKLSREQSKFVSVSTHKDDLEKLRNEMKRANRREISDDSLPKTFSEKYNEPINVQTNSNSYNEKGTQSEIWLSSKQKANLIIEKWNDANFDTTKEKDFQQKYEVILFGLTNSTEVRMGKSKEKIYNDNHPQGDFYKIKLSYERKLLILPRFRLSINNTNLNSTIQDFYVCNNCNGMGQTINKVIKPSIISMNGTGINDFEINERGELLLND